MSSNTNIGNTPVNQGYVQLIHTGETGGIDGTLRTLYDGDGTASDLQIASNKVKVSTELYIGSKTATEFIQDIVGDMFTTGSYTNITTTYDDTNGNIDLSASGEVTLTGTQTLSNKTLASPTFTGTANGANLTLTGDLTVSGDTIFTNSNTVLIGDAILTLNADETGSPTANAGFEVERGTSANKTFIWNETDDKWTIGSETFVASTVEANLTGNVTGNVTGSASLNLLKSSNLSDLANVATARSNLGVDPAGTDNSTDVTLVTTSHDYLSLAGQAITLGTIDISDDTNLVGGTGITLTGDTLSTTDSEIVHDNLNGFVANEHKDHSAISITTAASSGLSGGGDITTTRSLSVDVNNLDSQVPALELADKIAIYDNSATETNVATLTQLKAIVNTDTDTNQLTEFILSGDSGTDQTISHNNTLTISGGNGISTSTSATDILSVALGGFSTLIAQSSPAEQDLLVIEEAIGGAIKKVQIGALSSGITIDGTTANGILTYGGVNNIDTESTLTWAGSYLNIQSADDAEGGVRLKKSTKDGTHIQYSLSHRDDNQSLILYSHDGTTFRNWITIDEPNALLKLGSNSSALSSFNSDGDLDMYGDIEISATKKLYLDGGGDTYITEASADLVDMYVGAEHALRIADFGNTPYVYVPDNAYLGAGSSIDFTIRHDTSHTYITNSTGDMNFVEADAGNINFRNNSGTSHLYIKSGGNVGIGTNSPGNKLEVRGDIAVAISDTQDIIKLSDAGNDGSIELYTGEATPVLRTKLTAYGDSYFGNSNAQLGIGTTSPNRPLVVNGSSATFLSIVSGATDDGGILFGDSSQDYDGQIRYNNSSHHMFFKTNNTEQMRISSSGRVSIGNTNDSYKLDVTGDIRVSSGSLGVGVNPNATDGRGDFSNDVVAFSTSDKRLKENIKPLDSALDKVLKINGVEFDWKELTEEEKKTIHGNEGHDVGVIAQEIEEVLPEVVTTRDTGYKAVKYEKIVPLLIQAIKEQQQQIEELKNG